MSQFALYRLRDGDELVCRIQTDLGADTAYILCAPLVRRSDWRVATPILHVPVSVDGDDYLILMTQMIALPADALGAVAGTVAPARDQIVRAVDLLATGF